MSIFRCSAVLLALLLIASRPITAQTSTEDPLDAARSLIENAQYVLARTRLDKAFSSVSESSDPLHFAEIVFESARLDYNQGSFARAITGFERTRAILRPVHAADLDARAQSGLALAYDITGRPEAAAAAVRGALEEAAQSSILTQEKVLTDAWRIAGKNGRYREASGYALRRAELAGKLDSSTAVRAQLVLADTQFLMRELEGADRAIEEAEDTARNASDPNLQALLLLEKGKVRWARTLYTEAGQTLSEARKLFSVAGDRGREAEALEFLSYVDRDRGHLEDAVADSQQALAIRRENGDPLNECSELTDLGTIWRMYGSLAEAKASFAKAHDLARKTGFPRCEAWIFVSQSDLSSAQGDFPSASESAREALKLSETIGNEGVETSALERLSLAEVAWGSYKTEIETLNQALLKAEENGAVGYQMPLLLEIAAAYRYSLDYDHAKDYYQREIELAEKMGSRDRIANGQYQLALISADRGNYQAALDRALLLKDLQTQIGSDGGVAWSLGYIATQEIQLKRFAEAAGQLEEAFSIFSRWKNAAGQAWILSLESGISSRSYKDRREVMDQELRLRKTAGDLSGEIFCLDRIGRLLREESFNDQSRSFHQDALVIAQKIRNRRAESMLWNNIALTWGDQGFNTQAIDNLQKAIAIRHELGDEKEEAFLLGNLAVYLSHANRYLDADAALENALGIRHRLEDHSGEAETLGKLAPVYLDQGEPDTAIKLYERERKIWHELNRGDKESDVLDDLAESYEAKDDHEKALALVNEAMAMRGATSNTVDSVRTLNRRAEIFEGQSDYRQELATYRKVLQIYEETHNITGQTIVLHKIGQVENQSGHYKDALKYFEKSLDLAKKLEDAASIANTLMQLADVHLSLGQVQLGLKRYREALEIWKKQENWSEQSFVYYRIGAFYHQNGNYTLAIENLTTDLSITRNHQLPEIQQSVTLAEMGGTYADKGEYDLGLKTLEKSLEIAARHRDRHQQIQTLDSFSEFYRKLGQYQEALAKANEEEKLAERVHDHSYISMANYNQAYAYYSSGQTDRAIALFQASRQEAETANDGDLQRSALNMIGTVYKYLGDFENAETFLQEDLKLSSHEGDDDGSATTLLDLGDLERARRRFEKARDYYGQALPLLKKDEDFSGETVCLDDIAQTYLEEHEYAKARQYFEQTADLGRKQGLPLNSPEALRNLAVVSAAEHEYGTADRQFAQAAELFRKTNNRSAQANTLLADAMMNIDHGDPDKAIALLQQRLPLVEQFGDPLRESGTLFQLGRAFEKKGNLEQALHYYRQAIQKREELRMTAQHSDVEAGLADLTGVMYGTAVDLLSRMETKDSFEAFALAERSRAHVASSIVSNVTAKGLTPDRHAEEQKLRLEVVALEQNIQKISSEPDSPSNQALLEENKQKYASKFQEYNLFLREAGLDNADAIRSDASDRLLKQTIEGLDRGLTIVEYFVGAEHVIAFVIHQGQKVKCIRLNTTPLEISNKIDNLFPWPDSETAERRLKEISQLMIEPLRGDLRGGAIGFIPNGTLHRVPFAALRLGNSALIDQHDVFVLPALMTLPALMDGRKPWNSNIAIFAQPGPPGHFFLEGATSEAGAIAQLFHTAADSDATDSSFRAKAPEARIIHIAAHADINSEHPGSSKILMNNAAGAGGFLYLEDIRNLQFPHADLVVLSACETLKGPVESGDNMLAFNTAFLRAGAPSVVASLWKVDDRATQYLMTEFYKQLLLGVSKTRALRLAQLATRKGHPDPRDWAAFELTGDPGPMQATAIGANTILAVVIPTLGLILILWFLCIYFSRRRSSR